LGEALQVNAEAWIASCHVLEYSLIAYA